MEAASESIKPPGAPAMLHHAEALAAGVVAVPDVPGIAAPAESPVRWPTRGHRWARRSGRRRTRQYELSLGQFRFAVAVYVGTRLLLLAVALIDRELRHQTLLDGLGNWDGKWFRELAQNGYPTQVSHGQTTLGFFPLYPIMMWAVAHAFLYPGVKGVVIAGVIVSGIGGLVATVLVQQLATGWWGEDSGRRATLLFCLFPGSVVFSMVYSEGLLLPLAAGCILALERRRFVLAGVLAGAATAVQADALALIPVCATAAVLEIRRYGWRDRVARRSLCAPILSLAGILAFAGFLWAWTGTPLATYEGQHYGWGEKTDPFALVHQLHSLITQISFAHFNHPTINLNLPVGLMGAAILLTGVVLLLARPNAIPVEAMVWTLTIGFLAITSEFVPPNPRLLITAFPAVLVFAHRFKGRTGTALMVTNALLLAGMSYLTFVSHTLRP